MSDLHAPDKPTGDLSGRGTKSTSEPRQGSVLEVPENLTRMTDFELERWLSGVFERYPETLANEPPMTH